MDADTIFALSSGSLPSGVAIIRVSGPDVTHVISALCGSLPSVRQASVRVLRDPVDGMHLDQALVLYFQGPNSFTGEDVAELHCHGGRATVSAVLDCMSRQKGCRSAEAGEFSRRAFLNGRMDLTELEGLSDLVAAETEKQRKLALQQAGGSLRSIYEDWRLEIIGLRAFLEADFDFSDEEDVPGSISDLVWPRLELLIRKMQGHLSTFRQGEIIRDGCKVVLTGPPNAGKSTVFNGLIKRDAAIVTEIPGTTRDVLEARLDVDGYLVRLFDTAGIRETDDRIEKEGIARASAVLSEADLIIHLNPHNQSFNPTVDGGVRPVVYVTTHSAGNDNNTDTPSIDARSQGGIDIVIDIISTHLQTIKAVSQPLPTRIRYREGVEAALAALTDAIDTQKPPELRAEDLRSASDAIARLTGRIDVEDLLDVIFSEFCIGK